MKKTYSFSVLAMIGIGLVGCGGSGDGGGSSPAVTPNISANVTQPLPPVATSGATVPFSASIQNTSASSLSAANASAVTITGVSYPEVNGVDVIFDESAQINGENNCYLGDDTWRSLMAGESCAVSMTFENTSGASREISGNVVIHLSGTNIPSLSYPIQINFFMDDWTTLQSGQKQCYSASGSIACSSTDFPRQDGDVKAGVPWAFSRYQDNNDGTVTDLMTNLKWEQTPSATALNWSGALNRCNNLNKAGQTWRLPNIRELLSVVSYSVSPRPGSALNNNTPISGISGRYWSSSTYVLESDKAWGIDFANGNIAYNAFGTKASGSGKVWCVTGQTNTEFLAPVYQTGQEKCYGDNGIEISCDGTGQDAAFEAGIGWTLATRYDDNNDGTVTDTLTGLMWQKDPSVNIVNQNWASALNTCADLDLGGHTDWRLPNVLEWISLVDYNVANQAENLNDNTPFENIAGSGIGEKFDYWTSTSYSGAHAWSLPIWDGDIAFPGENQNESKSSTANTYVMCVRGGVSS